MAIGATATMLSRPSLARIGSKTQSHVPAKVDDSCLRAHKGRLPAINGLSSALKDSVIIVKNSRNCVLERVGK